MVKQRSGNVHLPVTYQPRLIILPLIHNKSLSTNPGFGSEWSHWINTLSMSSANHQQILTNIFIIPVRMPPPPHPTRPPPHLVTAFVSTATHARWALAYFGPNAGNKPRPTRSDQITKWFPTCVYLRRRRLIARMWVRNPFSKTASDGLRRLRKTIGQTSRLWINFQPNAPFGCSFWVIFIIFSAVPKATTYCIMRVVR